MSPVEQYTIDCEYLAYFEPKKLKKKSLKEILCNFSVDAKILKNKKNSVASALKNCLIFFDFFGNK